MSNLDFVSEVRENKNTETTAAVEPKAPVSSSAIVSLDVTSITHTTEETKKVHILLDAASTEISTTSRAFQFNLPQNVIYS